MTGIDFYRDKAGEWRWRAVARNGEVVADSGEGYRERRDAVHGAAVLLRLLLDQAIAERGERHALALVSEAIRDLPDQPTDDEAPGEPPRQFERGDMVRCDDLGGGEVLAVDGSAVWVRWLDDDTRSTVDAADLVPADMDGDGRPGAFS